MKQNFSFFYCMAVILLMKQIFDISTIALKLNEITVNPINVYFYVISRTRIRKLEAESART